MTMKNTISEKIKNMRKELSIADTSEMNKQIDIIEDYGFFNTRKQLVYPGYAGEDLKAKEVKAVEAMEKINGMARKNEIKEVYTDYDIRNPHPAAVETIRTFSRMHK